MMDFDPYVILGTRREATNEDLKAAYRLLVRENHPDIAPDKVAATLKMTRINAAWGIVGDPQKRAAFDARMRLDEIERARKTSARPVTARPSGIHKSASPSSKISKTATQSNTSSPKVAKTIVSKSTTQKSRSSASPTRSARDLTIASRLLFKLNRPEEALEICRAVLKTDFRNILARELMGEAYVRLGQNERALAIWEQALVLSPQNAILRRRWLQLMTPEARAKTQRSVSPTPPPVARQASRPFNNVPHPQNTQNIGNFGGTRPPSLWRRLCARLSKG